jgi:predicted alpha/beta hydrolase family esterase
VGFLILHGYEGNGPDHWQSWLAGRLRDAGHDVAYPDLPDPLRPDLGAWLATLERERRDGDVVVCHSLGCLLWLHHRARDGPPAARVLLVAPPCPSATEQVGALAGFFPAPLDPALARGARLVCSDDDPYCPEDARAAYAEPLAIEADLLPGAGHINPDSGYGPWPSALAWCQGAKKGVEA